MGHDTARKANPVTEGTRKARAMRRELGIAPQQPADPFWIAARLGLVVVARQLSERKIAGAYLYWADGDMRFVLVNATDPLPRQRFTMAHEIAHSIFEPNGTVVDDDVQATSSDPAAQFAEKRANAFAAELLLPEESAKRWKPKQPWGEDTNDVAELASNFEVSYEATLWRLKSAALIDDSIVQALRERFADIRPDLRQRLQVRGDEALRLPDDFVAMAKEALAKHLISAKRFAELTTERNEPFLD
jgi:Zn-dependent peptidase ImmA (M78 family)